MCLPLGQSGKCCKYRCTEQVTHYWQSSCCRPALKFEVMSHSLLVVDINRNVFVVFYPDSFHFKTYWMLNAVSRITIKLKLVTVSEWLVSEWSWSSNDGLKSSETPDVCIRAHTTNVLPLSTERPHNPPIFRMSYSWTSHLPSADGKLIRWLFPSRLQLCSLIG